MSSINVQHLNRTYSKYPITVEDKGWVYGVWYCSTSWLRADMYGQHPLTYLNRLCALFPDAKDWLHAPGGVVPHGEYHGGMHTTLDLVSRKLGYPMVLGSVASLPFDSCSFDVVETDPPYSDADSKIYGTPKYPRRKAMQEFWRVLRPGDIYVGWTCVIHPIDVRCGIW